LKRVRVAIRIRRNAVAIALGSISCRSVRVDGKIDGYTSLRLETVNVTVEPIHVILDPIHPDATIYRVVASAGAEEVVSISAVEGVIAITSFETVVVGIARDHIAELRTADVLDVHQLVDVAITILDFDVARYRRCIGQVGHNSVRCVPIVGAIPITGTTVDEVVAGLRTEGLKTCSATDECIGKIRTADCIDASEDVVTDQGLICSIGRRGLTGCQIDRHTVNRAVSAGGSETVDADITDTYGAIAGDDVIARTGIDLGKGRCSTLILRPEACIDADDIVEVRREQRIDIDQCICADRRATENRRLGAKRSRERGPDTVEGIQRATGAG